MPNAIDLKGLVRPQLVEATKREDNPNSAEFRLQPLERGFGHTLGNAMRRMLLSSLRGSAVWGILIDGVLHEHQTIPGVVEDVHQIIGNLKNLTLSLDEGKEDGILRISKGESGAVTSGDIELNPVRPPAATVKGKLRNVPDCSAARTAQAERQSATRKTSAAC